MSDDTFINGKKKPQNVILNITLILEQNKNSLGLVK